VGSVILLFLSSYGGYRAYQYTDSVTFCGQLCHKVMKPEFVSHQDSPHARVKCVGCPAGPGATWYVRSKLSGLYQVYATLLNKYPRPIPGTITDLRPARQVCEQCHWPKAFWGEKEQTESFFLSDEKNSRWNVSLLLKIGGETPDAATAKGIHWHIASDVKIEYIATDHDRQTIPWVKVTYLKTGKSVVFETSDSALKSAQKEQAEPRTMDCLDCHNRPSHRYLSPVDSVNLALASGRISSKLPYVKDAAVEVLSKQYSNSDSAEEGIEKGIHAYYQKKSAQLLTKDRELISDAVGQLRKIYSQNFFPSMKARWTDYPDNLGHWIFPGCMRCHDGNHKSKDGKIVPNDCRTCHIILSQGKPGQEEYMNDPKGLEFHHPAPIGGMWQTTPCTECHSGGD